MYLLPFYTKIKHNNKQLSKKAACIILFYLVIFAERKIFVADLLCNNRSLIVNRNAYALNTASSILNSFVI